MHPLGSVESDLSLVVGQLYATVPRVDVACRIVVKELRKHCRRKDLAFRDEFCDIDAFLHSRCSCVKDAHQPMTNNALRLFRVAVEDLYDLWIAGQIVNEGCFARRFHACKGWRRIADCFRCSDRCANRLLGKRKNAVSSAFSGVSSVICGIHRIDFDLCCCVFHNCKFKLLVNNNYRHAGLPWGYSYYKQTQLILKNLKKIG